MNTNGFLFLCSIALAMQLHGAEEQTPAQRSEPRTLPALTTILAKTIVTQLMQGDILANLEKINWSRVDFWSRKNILEAPIPGNLRAGATLLHKAALDLNLPLIKKLIAINNMNGVLVIPDFGDIRDHARNTPLHYLSASNAINIDQQTIDQIVGLLIQNGAQVDTTNIFLNTPIGEAIASGNLPIIEALRTHGAQLNVPLFRRVQNVGEGQFFSRYWPAHYAVIQNNLALFKYLLSHNVEIRPNPVPLLVMVPNNAPPDIIAGWARNNFAPVKDDYYPTGQRPHDVELWAHQTGVTLNIIELALQSQNGQPPRSPEFIIALTQSHPESIEPAIATSIQSHNDAAARALIDAYPDHINNNYGNGNTALHYAAGADDINAIEYLLAHNATVNAVNDELQTPLDMVNLVAGPDAAESRVILRAKGALTYEEIEARRPLRSRNR